eukprot:4431684-Pyramimonas_sp.AAC.1
MSTLSSMVFLYCDGGRSLGIALNDTASDDLFPHGCRDMHREQACEEAGSAPARRTAALEVIPEGENESDAHPESEALAVLHAYFQTDADGKYDASLREAALHIYMYGDSESSTSSSS